MIKKIVILGPESTGKSTLCQQLADHYQSLWCPEYAREYLLKNGMDYSYDDLLIIAKGQLELEEQFIKKVESKSSSPVLFIDTDMYVMKVWCEYVFGKCHPFILNQIVTRQYDGYLLCNTDLPWVKDELREYPDLKSRQELFLIYKDLLINQSSPWSLVSGDTNARFEVAKKAVDEMLQK